MRQQKHIASIGVILKRLFDERGDLRRRDETVDRNVQVLSPPEGVVAVFESGKPELGGDERHQRFIGGSIVVFADAQPDVVVALDHPEGKPGKIILHRGKTRSQHHLLHIRVSAVALHDVAELDGEDRPFRRGAFRSEGQKLRRRTLPHRRIAPEHAFFGVSGIRMQFRRVVVYVAENQHLVSTVGTGGAALFRPDDLKSRQQGKRDDGK